MQNIDPPDLTDIKYYDTLAIIRTYINLCSRRKNNMEIILCYVNRPNGENDV